MHAPKTPAESFCFDAEPHILAARDFVDLLVERLGKAVGLDGREQRAFSRIAFEAQAELEALEEKFIARHEQAEAA